MSLTLDQTREIVNEHSRGDNDTGSPGPDRHHDHRIQQLTEHLKVAKKDPPLVAAFSCS